jgi:glycosyltransferase involved in cell wall biosynthesis
VPEVNISILPPILFDELAVKWTPIRDPRRVLFAGRIVREKGLGMLLEALAGINAEWRLDVVGDGPDKIPSQALAQELGIADRVHFVGWVDQERLQAYYKASAFVAVPSLWPEPFGRIGPESFLAGRAVIAFDVGGISAWLENNVSGFLVPARNVRDLRRAIEALLRTPEEQVRMGRNAQLSVRERWSSSMHVAELLFYLGAAIKTSL